MKPAFALPANASAQQTKSVLDDTFGKMGESCVSSLIVRSLTAGANKVAHGFPGTPRWRLYNPEGPYPVHQYQPSDKTFLYLYVTGGDLRTGIEVF
jgi:hypothetical protein